MSSIGALLDFLTRERATGELDDVEGASELDICSIEALALCVIFSLLVTLLNFCQRSSDACQRRYSLVSLLC